MQSPITLLALLVAGATPPASSDPFAEVVLQRVRAQARRDGLVVRTGALSLEREASGTWTLELRTDHGQVRARSGLRLSPSDVAAASRVRQALDELMGPFRVAAPRDSRLLASDPGRPSTAEAGPSVEVEPKGSGGFAARFVAESGLGLVGGGFGGLAGTGLTIAVYEAARCELGSCYHEAALGIAGMVGAALGTAAGVTLGGAIGDGRGNFGWALLGSAAGAAVTSPLLAGAVAIRENEGAGTDWTGLVVGASVVSGIATLGGSVLFYELFGDRPQRARPSELTRRPTWRPTFASDGRVTAFGVGGTF